MTWYYLENHERRGPVEEAAFRELIARGTILPETLVWRSGQATWLPCREVLPGASPPALDPAELLIAFRSHGGYRLPLGKVCTDAWHLVQENLGPCLGATTLAVTLLWVVGQTSCIGYFATFFVNGPIFAGLFLFLLRQVRGDACRFSDLFAGFKKSCYGQLALAGTVQIIALTLVTFFMLLPVELLRGQTPRSDWRIVISLPAIYLSAVWVLSYALIIDQRLRFWDAMELSRKLVQTNLRTLITIALVNLPLAAVQVLSLNQYFSLTARPLLAALALALVLPLTISMLMVIYQSILATLPVGAQDAKSAA